jgi:transcriptional regulator with XRE-family HTH domain
MVIGELVRDLRLTLGWSQSRLAEALCSASGHATVTREEVSRWERGKRRPGPFWLRHLAAVLQVPLEVLEHNVKRREFITDVAGAAVAPLVASDLIQSGFAARLARDNPSADEWRTKVSQYGADYMRLGAGEIQQRLAGDLVVLQQQLDDPELWSVASRLMTVYGKTMPGSNGAKAIQWYLMAAEAADQAGDEQSRVWVRGRAAIALGYEGASLGVAEMFADQAIAISERFSLGRLNAIMAKAHVAALRGEKQMALKLMDDGRRVFDAAGSHEQTSDYAIPEWRMAVFTSLLLARLGEERMALEAQETALKNLPATLPRFATHVEMHQGLMLVRAGDVSGGVEHARAALAKLPPNKHSLTLRLLMAEIEAHDGRERGRSEGRRKPRNRK